jgi:Family of unknown function (DUF6494)
VDEDALNLSTRKFLKRLGISAQREIELGVRDRIDEGRLEGTERLQARAVVTVEGLDREIVVDGEITLGG